MLTENQAAFEIGLWGQHKARAFLASLLERFQGNMTTVRSALSNEAPIHDLTPEEKASTDDQAIKEWHAPPPESLHEKAVQIILSMDDKGIGSGDLRRATGVTSVYIWNYQGLRLLKSDPRVSSTGCRHSLRWFKAKST